MYVETIMKADIFFFVATICMIIFTVLLSIALIYFIYILKDIKKATGKIDSNIEKAKKKILIVQEKIASHPLVNMFFSKKKKRKTE